MNTIYCGCSDLPREKRVFYQTATAIEYRVGLFTPPKARVLKAWAQDAQAASHPMRSIWVAWQAFTHRPGDIKKGFGLKLQPGESAANLGHFQKTPENIRVWQRIREQAVNVGASRILLETSANFTPSDANKRALAEFASNWADLPDGMKLIWHPAGFWEREEAQSIAMAHDMILAIDPLVDVREDLPEGSEAYFQMLGRHGLLDSYSDDDLETLLDAAAQYDDCTIIFRTTQSLNDAKRTIQLAKTYVPNDDFGDDFDDFDDDFDESDDDFDESDESDDDFDEDDDIE